MLITVLTGGEVGSDLVVQEVGQTLTSVAENFGVNITVISVQRIGEYNVVVTHKRRKHLYMLKQPSSHTYNHLAGLPGPLFDCESFVLLCGRMVYYLFFSSLCRCLSKHNNLSLLLH